MKLIKQNEIIMKHILSLFFFLLLIGESFSQSTNDILNLLISNKTISQLQADSVRAEAALLQQQTDATRKTFFVTAARQMQLSGYSQVRFQALQEEGKKDGFDIRRARLDLKGSLSPYFSYRVQADLADKPKLIDGYGEIKMADYFSITAGQFKIPFSLENLASSNKLEMIDRSQVVEALVARGKDVIGNQNGRDVGIQVSGTIVKVKDLPLVEYRLGVFNGSGINVADTANEAKDIAGRLIFTPMKGFSFGGGFYNGWDKAIKPDVPGQSQTRNRIGGEVSYVSTRFSLKGEYISGKDGKTTRAGWYAQAAYFIIPQKLQVLGKYDVYDPNTSSPDNILTNYVFGGNYNFNSWSKLQAFYTIRQEEGTSVNNNYFSVQYQIRF
ncbi:MAG: porin [Bacteroidales bacterium]|nr:porin [Bacteroidales bacterium]